MIEEKEFIDYFNYIGITNKTHQKSIIKCYQKSFEEKARVSTLRSKMEKLGYEEGAFDNVMSYIIFPQYREKTKKEIKKNKGLFGKKF